MIRTRASKVNTAKWYNSGAAILNRTVPTLYHDFANQRYYDTALGETAFPYTSVHRSSNAMMFDVNGNLVWAPANMIPQSSTAGAVVGVIGSGGAVPTGWARSIATGITHEVLAVTSTYIDIRISGTNAIAGLVYPQITTLSTPLTASVGDYYTGSIYVSIIDGNTSGFASSAFKVNTQFLNSGSYVNEGAQSAAATSTHSRLVSTGAVVSGANQVRVSLNLTVNALATVDATFRIGQPQLERTDALSPKQYIETTGSAYYGPRFDYDPFTHEPLGLLVEQSRSNDVAQGLSLNSSVGTFQDGTGSNGPTYLGGWSSARYTGNGVSNPHFYFAGSVTPGASTSRSVSAIVAYVDTQYLQLCTSANWALDAANTYMNIDAIAGTITASGSAITDTFIKKLANNVYHIGFTCVSSAAPTGGAGAIIAPINTSTAGRLPSYSHTSSFDVIYLFNGAGVGWNSITPTFGTAATRAADVATMPTGSWFNQEQSVIYMETVPTSSAGTAKRAICINDGTANNAMSLIKSGSSLAQIRTVIGGVSSFSPTTANAVVDFQNTKFAALLNSPTKKMVLNGGAVASSSVAFPTSGYTTLNTGSEPSSTGYWGGWIKQIRYYNTASPSDAQLQTLTT